MGLLSNIKRYIKDVIDDLRIISDEISKEYGNTKDIKRLNNLGDEQLPENQSDDINLINIINKIKV